MGKVPADGHLFGAIRSSMRADADQSAVTPETVQQLYQAGEIQAAYEAVRRLRRSEPISTEARLLEARIAFDLGRKQESLHAWQSLAALPVKSAEIQHEMGMHLVQLGAVQSGLRALKLAVESDPNQLKYHLDLSAAHLAGNNIHTAQAVLLQARRRHPTDQNLSIAIARLFESQGNWNRAAHYYGLALASNPENPTLLRQRGRMRYQLGQLELAQQDFAACEAEMIENKHWPALLEYGQTCLKTNDWLVARKIAAVLTQHVQPDLQLAQFTAAVAATPLTKPPVAVPEKSILVATAKLDDEISPQQGPELKPQPPIQQSVHVQTQQEESPPVIQAESRSLDVAKESGWRPTSHVVKAPLSAPIPQSGWNSTRSRKR